MVGKKLYRKIKVIQLFLSLVNTFVNNSFRYGLCAATSYMWYAKFIKKLML